MDIPPQVRFRFEVNQGQVLIRFELDWQLFRLEPTSNKNIKLSWIRSKWPKRGTEFSFEILHSVEYRFLAIPISSITICLFKTLFDSQWFNPRPGCFNWWFKLTWAVYNPPPHSWLNRMVPNDRLSWHYPDVCVRFVASFRKIDPRKSESIAGDDRSNDD